MKLRFEKVACDDGPDGGGKQFLLYEATLALLLANEIEVDGKQYSPDDLNLFITSFPAYNVFGSLIRKSFSKEGSRFFEDEGIDMYGELHVRKAMFALDRLLTLMVINSIIARNPDKKNLWLSDRIDIAQINTLAYVLDKYNINYLPPELLENLLDADYELRQLINPISGIIIPQSAANLAQFSGGRVEDHNDGYERLGPQEIAVRGYNWAVQNLPNTFQVQTQNPNGSWRDKDILVNEFLENIGIKIKGRNNRLHTKDTSTSEILLDARGRRFLNSIGGWEFVTEMYPLAAKALSKYDHENPLYRHSLAWQDANYLDIDHTKRRLHEVVPGIHKMDRKQVLKYLENEFSGNLGELMMQLRVSPAFLKTIDPYLTSIAFPRLFGSYTDGKLFKYIKYLASLDSRYLGYANMLTDIAPWLKNYE